jgi:uncharacterized radical SAM superfamily Fe-S cluster-containing enzyme
MHDGGRPEAGLEGFTRKVAPYVFLGQTLSMCEECWQLVPTKIMREGDNVFYQKRCR